MDAFNNDHVVRAIVIGICTIIGGLFAALLKKFNVQIKNFYPFTMALCDPIFRCELL
jgi:hypothetical protein